jgi:lactoylglutathione lyase
MLTCELNLCVAERSSREYKQYRNVASHSRLNRREDQTMAKPVHSMIRVLDEARSVDYYKRALDLDVAERVEFESATLIYMRHPSSSFELELTINKGRTEPYALGEGYGHLAFVVDDVVAEHARFEQAQLSPGPLFDVKYNGKAFAHIFFATDPDGYQIELMQRAGRFG